MRPFTATRRPHLLALAPLVLAGCWKLDLVEVPADRISYQPDVGAPPGWFVEGFEMELTCPDGEQARYYLLYPEEAVGEDAPAIPLAILFHSGAFDYVITPDPSAPLTGPTFQRSTGDEARLDLTWAAERVFATLGIYPNYDDRESHVGALPAALATKGFAVMMPSNCWGDLWRNRQSSEAENNFGAEFFFRNGRASAEFAWQLGVSESPVLLGEPLPINVDAERLALIGLGDGGRAIGELLAIQSSPGAFPYRARSIVVDSLADDLDVYAGTTAGDDERAINAGLNRIFSGVDRAPGSMSCLPSANMPERIGVMFSTNDSRIPTTANDALLARFGTVSGESTRLGAPRAACGEASASRPTREVWIHQGIGLTRPLSNSDVGLAKAIADFVADGLTAVDTRYVD